jgi:type II secretory pathway pseudopilin PulG
MRRVPRTKGISRVELLVVVAVVGVIGGVFLERMRYYQEYAEMTAVDVTVEHMRTGLRYRVGELLVDSRMSEISSLADENPVNWLDTRPPNYLGEFDGAPPETDVKGQWYFDSRQHELVYTANNRRFFTPAAYRDYTVRLRAVRLQGDPRDPAQKGQPAWVSLVQVSDGRWLQ